MNVREGDSGWSPNRLEISGAIAEITLSNGIIGILGGDHAHT
jgi:hypothetical protein